jgi:hypothetical protein
VRYGRALLGLIRDRGPQHARGPVGQTTRIIIEYRKMPCARRRYPLHNRRYARSAPPRSRHYRLNNRLICAPPTSSAWLGRSAHNHAGTAAATYDPFTVSEE